MQLQTAKNDFSASLVVFLVALPLCLGIASASSAPALAGLIAGAIGGIVVGLLSQSKLGVSGPAAGLAVIVAQGVSELGDIQLLFVAVALSGLIQISFALLRAGVIAYYFPSSVIKGMLSGIGIIIVLKQLPLGLGIVANSPPPAGALEPNWLIEQVHLSVMFIALLSLGILTLWETQFFRRKKIFRIVQGPLVAVGGGLALQALFAGWDHLLLSPAHYVQVPVHLFTDEWTMGMGYLSKDTLMNYGVYRLAFVIALVGSIETLLCAEATDRLDPKKTKTPANRELMAQGAGNILSGLLGGLPITQVIVRSSVNIQAGAQSKISAVLHGFLIVIAVIFGSSLINQIPLACLAAILIMIGYKLSRPLIFMQMWRRGYQQFVPFIATIISIIFIDLLAGVFIGLIFSFVFILYKNNGAPMSFVIQGDHRYITFAENMSFLKKVSLQRILHQSPDKSVVEIDANNSYYIDPDIIETVEDFILSSKDRNIVVKVKGMYKNISSKKRLGQ
jgi:MFS superfamily sulfate permease-like transporter